MGFVTNNSYQSKQLFESRFHDELEHEFNYKEDLLHPAEATVTYLKSIDFQGMIYLIASDPFRAVLEAAGFQCLAMVIGKDNFSSVLFKPTTFNNFAAQFQRSIDLE